MTFIDALLLEKLDMTCVF